MSPSRGQEWGRTFAAAGAAGALVLALRTVVVGDPAVPNAEFLPDMARSPAWMSQMDGAPTPDGLSDRALPAGVVPRGRLPFRYGATPEEAARAGRELTNPFGAADAAATERGAVVFARNCVPCHGADGEGRGGAVLRGMILPPSLLAERARTMPDGQMFHVVTVGQGNMASYAVQIEPDDRWKAILHVRRLQQGGVR
jgi:mono/diheme cytochrome c family protein